MKYSIELDGDLSHAPIVLNSQYAATCTNHLNTSSLELYQGKFKLNHFTNPNSKQEQFKEAKISSVETEVGKQMQWQKLKLIWCGSDQWILCFQNPFRLFYFLNKYNKLVPIVLEQELPLIQVACWVNYPQLIIYGHNQSTFTNHIYSINLLTFETKEIPPAKNYSPGNRRDYWAYFSDNRLYIYGGVDKKGKAVEELLWTFNLQNGNWFALDMPSNNLGLPFDGFTCEMESGKVLVLTSKSLLLIELYQSRMSEVEGWQEAVGSEYTNVKGFYIYRGNLYLHNGERSLGMKLKIIKTKVKK